MVAAALAAILIGKEGCGMWEWGVPGCAMAWCVVWWGCKNENGHTWAVSKMQRKVARQPRWGEEGVEKPEAKQTE